MDLDLHIASYEDFVTYVFAHPPTDLEHRWYFETRPDIRVEPRTAVAYMTRLVKSTERIVGLFTVPQITQGLDFLFGYGSEWFGDQLWNAAVRWPERRTLILAIPDLYPAFFERNDEEGLGFMLWDKIAFGYDSGTRDPGANAEEARVQDAIFSALTGMLRSENADTQAAAVHGLGHLKHASSTRAIQELLHSGRQLEPEVRDYAMDVLGGRFR